MIEFINFEKWYGPFQAVKPTSFSIEKGEVFGLLGPNGSGKSTLLRSVVGLLKPTHGDIIVDGQSVNRERITVKKKLAYMPQRITMPDTLKGREIIQFYADLRELPEQRIDEVLQFTHLNGHSHKRVGDYSGGLLQRLGLAIAFLSNAPILILDEPTLNLDPRGMQQFRRFIEQRKAEGVTILFASHILADAESLADRIGIMVEGSLVKVESIDTFRQEIHDRSVVAIQVAHSREHYQTVASEAGADRVWFENGTMCIQSAPGKRLAILQALVNAGLEVDRFASREPGLDQLIMEHFGEED